jgi:peptidoglycan hydrolase-like protein with peptidoglycan-binding domain
VVNTTLNTVTCTTTGFSFFALFGTTTTTSSSHSSGSGIRYGCKDTNASNYEYFASHKQSLCEYGKNTTNTNTSAHNFTRNLKLGDVNEEVRSLQKLLNELGFTVSITGVGSVGNETNMFGPATQAALIRYQVSKGITPAIGYFGPLTKDSLGTTPSVQTNPVISSEQTQNLESLVFAAPLYSGLQSADVRRLQTLLATKSEIYPEGLITGYFGPLTEKAVQTFQLNYGVVGSKFDSGFGLVGPKTRAKLQEVFGN